MALLEACVTHFGERGATHVATAPGRINLIGEHIDYLGLPVFPMALQRHVAIHFRAREDNLVEIANSNADFGRRSFVLKTEIEPFAAGDWGNYAKAAALGVMKMSDRLRGIDALVDSDLVVAAGLSSSSALVVAVALALLAANELVFEPLELAELMAGAERYVGLEGGGMDQAVCLAARAGHACRIDFNPLRVTPVRVPAEWRFVVASSLVTASKSNAVRKGYNSRVRQCREALCTMTEALGLDDRVDSYRELFATVSEEELVRCGEETLSNDLFERFRHVVTECGRVLAAQGAMAADDIERFGQLMIASHESLRDDFKVSCPELNELVDISLAADAVGARLTGAGFGGCIVALCHSSSVGDLIGALERKFYEGRRFAGALEHHLFVASPVGGASVGRSL
ncbi:MAG: galactokinase [Gemmatimonadales bacterium]